MEPLHDTNASLCYRPVATPSPPTAPDHPDDAFKNFLLLNPQLSNGGLFLHYYSKDLMLKDPVARTQVVLPDKVALPSLVGVSEAKLAGGQGVVPIEERFGPAKPLTDAEFLAKFREKSLPSWGHEVKIRAIWCLLQEHSERQRGAAGGGEDGRRGGGTNKVMEALQAVEGASHNVTGTLFWVQMVTFCRAKASSAASGDA